VFSILEAYLEELDAGLSANPGEMLARYPEIAEQLRPYLASLEFLHGIAASLRGTGESAPETDPDTNGGTTARAEQILGDYRIYREVGRGGMGIVYEAEQISLRRRVALKVLPYAAVLDSRQLRRFQNEAQAAARLHHTNIVPVYSVGCERGVHYYAMQYIAGRDLESVINEFRQTDEQNVKSSSGSRQSRLPHQTKEAAFGSEMGIGTGGSTRDVAYFRSAAVLIAQAAEGLDHAHQHGIIHRDVKPSNLLLDAAGTLWVTDFGLAKFDATRSFTGTGDILGTARYMSPEQVRGSYLDERTDIYSLGITLYELCTLRQAFDGLERARILARIESDDPIAPRRVKPHVPRDLEVIIQKAIAKDPADRYVAASALAADLRAFAAGRSILARKPSLAVRARRWILRHGRLVAVGVALLAMAAAGLATGSILLFRADERTRAALQTAEQERAAAEANFQLAQDAVERLLGRVGGVKLANLPGFESVRRELLEDALGFYERFLEKAPQDSRLQRQVVKALGAAGVIRRQLGKAVEAEAAFSTAAEAAEVLVAESPGDSAVMALLATQLNDLGVALRELGRAAESEAPLRRAVELREKLAVNANDAAEALVEVGAALGNLGSTLGKLGKPREARELLEQAVRRFEAAERETPGHAKAREGLSYQWKNLGLILASLGARQEAEAAFEECLQVRAKLVGDHPGASEHTNLLADIRFTRGVYYQLTGRSLEAEREYREGLMERERLAADYPAVPAYHRDLGALLNNLAMMVLDRGELGEARAFVERAVKEQEEAIRLSPVIEAARENLCNHLGTLADIARDLGDAAAAEQAYRQLIAVRQKLVDERPGDRRLKETISHDWDALGLLLRKANRDGEAKVALEEALRICETLIAEGLRTAALLSHAGSMKSTLGYLANDEGKPAVARALLRDGIDLHLAAVRTNPGDRDARKNLERDLAEYSGVLEATGDAVSLARLGEEIAALEGAGTEELLMAADLCARAGRLLERDHRLAPEVKQEGPETMTLRVEELRRKAADLSSRTGESGDRNEPVRVFTTQPEEARKTQ
jgi:serine/threonine protein kinase/tetratricopeptide (TPR) repeat protein